MIRLNYPQEGIINAFTRRPINLLDPTPDMITIEDIAHALSNICRFGGHASEFYSVAQHSVLVAYLAPRELHQVALLHDASEAYLGDVVKPLKCILGQPYLNLECGFQQTIAKRFGIENWFDHAALIKPADQQAIKLEFDYLFCDDRSGGLTRAFGTENTCWPSELAKDMFLTYFKLYEI